MDPTRRRPVGYLCQMRYTQPRPQRADHIPVHVTGRKLSSAVAGHAPALRCPLPSAWSSHCQSRLAAHSSLRVGLPGSASDWSCAHQGSLSHFRPHACVVGALPASPFLLPPTWPFLCPWELPSSSQPQGLYSQFLLPGYPSLSIRYPSQWILKCGTWTISSRATRNLTEMQVLRLSPDLLNQN